MKQDPAFSCHQDSAPRGGCGGRRKRRKKMLGASDIRLLLLHFIVQNDAYGYEMIKFSKSCPEKNILPAPVLFIPI